MAKVFIGTSGWVYKHWNEKFYPEDLPQKKSLEYYSQKFKTVEINSTFYHSAKPQTFKTWASKVPEKFIFSVKASRYLTHLRKLEVSDDSIKYQFESAKALGKKLGPLLFQFPRWKKDIGRLESFLKRVKKFKGYRLAFEFRHKSWFEQDLYDLLRKYDCALVIAESGDHWPCVEEVTADFVYLRFHGQGALYSSKYSDKQLKEWASKIKKWKRSGRDVYAYFNNDVEGFAVENANRLKEMI